MLAGKYKFETSCYRTTIAVEYAIDFQRISENGVESSIEMVLLL